MTAGGLYHYITSYLLRRNEKKRLLIKRGYYGFHNQLKENTIIIQKLYFGIMRILDVSHISSRWSSFRITLPKKIIRKLGLSNEEIISFGEKDGEVVIKKMKIED
jgi:hypothetical protein